MTKYAGDTEQIRVLKEALKESLKETLREVLREFLLTPTSEASPFPLYTVKQVARTFGVSGFTIRAWVRQGEIHPRYQVLSGRTYRLIFTTPDLLAFFERNFPSEADLGHPCDPRSRKGALIKKMFALNRLYARRRQPASREDREED